jgi:hypothetical protein
LHDAGGWRGRDGYRTGMATETTRTPAPQDEPTIGKLVADASRDISTLISKEIELAKAELKVSVTAGGLGAGMLVAALYILTIAFVVLSIAAAYLISWDDRVMTLKWSFLVVFGAWTLLAVMLVVVGIGRLKKVRAPEHAIAEGKKIPRALKGQR